MKRHSMLMAGAAALGLMAIGVRTAWAQSSAATDGTV